MPKSKRSRPKFIHELQEELDREAESKLNKEEANAERAPKPEPNPKQDDKKSFWSQRGKQEADLKECQDLMNRFLINFKGDQRKFEDPDFDYIPLNSVDVPDSSKTDASLFGEMVLPSCYYSGNIKEKIPPFRLGRFGDTALVMLFYLNTQNELHVKITIELYRRNWRYHKLQQIWITGLTPETQKMIQNKSKDQLRGVFAYVEPTDMKMYMKEIVIWPDTLSWVEYAELLKDKGPRDLAEATADLLRSL